MLAGWAPHIVEKLLWHVLHDLCLARARTATQHTPSPNVLNFSRAQKIGLECMHPISISSRNPPYILHFCIIKHFLKVVYLCEYWYAHLLVHQRVWENGFQLKYIQVRKFTRSPSFLHQITCSWTLVKGFPPKNNTWASQVLGSTIQACERIETLVIYT